MNEDQKPIDKTAETEKGYKQQKFSFTPEKETKLYCIISYVYILWIVGLLADNKNPKVRFHVNQGIILSIFFFSSLFAIKILSVVLFSIAPILTFLTSFFQIVWIILSVTYISIGIKNAIKDNYETLPFIGELFVVLK